MFIRFRTNNFIPGSVEFVKNTFSLILLCIRMVPNFSIATTIHTISIAREYSLVILLNEIMYGQPEHLEQYHCGSWLFGR